MAANFKIPPVFHEGSNYEGWKNEVNIWKLVTDLDKKKQALAVTLSLSGKPREVALEIPSASLNSEDGMTVLINALDNVFLSDEQDNSYAAYTCFEQFKKAQNMSMNDYIIEFERLYNKTKKFHMELPDPVLAFKLLDSCNLTNQEKQLALTATTDKTLASMKTALKRIFGGNTTTSQAIAFKDESALYVNNKSKGNYNKRFNKQQFQTNKQKPNPLNKYGKTSRCSVCQSIYHWRKNCPHDQAEVNITQDIENKETEECNALFTKESPDAHEIFVIESLGSAIIDTACTRTVCGEKWLNHFISQLSNSDKQKISTFPSKKNFKFGDGRTVCSSKTVKFPAKIGDRKCNISTEVVNADIPLLLSKESLQKAGTILDLKRDKAEMFNKDIPLELTSSGHYCISVLDGYENEDVKPEDITLIVNGDTKSTENISTIIKLHKQFGHASADRLKKLLQNAGVDTYKWVNLINKVVKECEICMKNKQSPPKPAVSLPLAHDFNDMVAVDLHELEKGTWYLHIIDMFTRFSAGSIMKTKNSSEFVKHFIKSWISIHGPPRTIYSDNGGEFNNEEVHTMAENFNFEIKTTAAFSPWSNGLLERHNKTLTEIMLKIKMDQNYDWDTTLHWALMAKNTLVNVHGFSPYQLLYGRNPNLPNIINDKLPALEGSTTSQVVAHNIKALYSARKAFTEAECSERIRRAIRKQTRPSSEKYVTGEKVFYKRPDSTVWKGPGTVIGQDSVVVFVRHGGIYVRVHQSRLQRVNDTQQKNPAESNIQDDNNIIDTKEDTIINNQQEYNSDEEHDNTPVDQEINEENPLEAQPIDIPPPEEEQQINLTKLKTGQVIQFNNRDTGNYSIGKILGRATSKNNKWYNFEYLEPTDKAGQKISIDLSTVDNVRDLDITQNGDNNEDVFIVKDVSFADAKQAELHSWKENMVYEIVPDVGQKCISTRWICSLKELPSGVIPKARLVARGFEDHHVDIQTDSPTCATESIRTVLAVIAQKQWEVQTMDIKTAFLQGADMSRTVYIKPPKEANTPNVIWKLKKCVYGLSDASLSWYKRVRQVMSEAGAKTSMVDPAVFYWLDKVGNVQGVLASHVDDFIWGGSDTFKQTVIPIIRKAFKIGKEESQKFSYVGIEIFQKNNNIFVSQQNYIDNLHLIHIDRIRKSHKDSILSDNEVELLRSKAGQLLWVARQSRPDILFDVCCLESRIKTATVQQLIDTNKIIKKVKSDSVLLKYQHLGNDSSIYILAFTDASLGNLDDGATQGGHFIALCGENGYISPLIWQSKRIRRVVRSTLAGETLALAEGMDCAIFLATLYSELTTGTADPKIIPIICMTDNKSLCEAIKSTKYVSERRLRLEISHIKELINDKQIQELKWMDTKHQLADCLTKKGASPYELLKAIELGQYNLKTVN